MDEHTVLVFDVDDPTHEVIEAFEHASATHPIRVTSVPDTGGSFYAAVASTEPLTQDEAQRIYDRWETGDL